jgi:hypothetical protein
VKGFKHVGTDADLAHLMLYLTALRSQMRMDNWNIIVMKEHADSEEDGVMASSLFPENHSVINLYLSSGWSKMREEQKSSTLCHELIHAQHRDVADLWDKASRGALSETAHEAWDQEFRMFMERFVSWIEERIRPNIPGWDEIATEVGDGIMLEGQHV